MFLLDGKITGIEAHNAREVGLYLQRRIENIPMPFAELIPALEAGRIDVIMSGLTVTAQRQQRVSFAEPFMQVGQMAIILLKNAGRFGPTGALYRDGNRIGVEPGTTGDKYARTNLTGSTVVPVADSAAAFEALRSGLVDFYIHDAPTSWMLSESRENQDLLSLFRPLTTEGLAWAVAKDNQRLLLDLNAALGELKRNGRLRAIQNYWIPTTIVVQ